MTESIKSEAASFFENPDEEGTLVWVAGAYCCAEVSMKKRSAVVSV